MKTLKLKFELHQKVYYFEENDVNRLVEGEIVKIELGNLDDISGEFYPAYYVMRHNEYEKMKKSFGIASTIKHWTEQKFEHDLAKTKEELIMQMFKNILSNAGEKIIPKK